MRACACACVHLYIRPILCVRQLHGNTEERLMMKRLNIAAGMGMGGSRYGGENKLDPAMEEVMDFKQTVLKEVWYIPSRTYVCLK